MFETYTIDRCDFEAHLRLFQNFPSIPRSKNEVWSQKNVSLELFSWKNSNFVSSTDQNLTTNDSFGY